MQGVRAGRGAWLSLATGAGVVVGAALPDHVVPAAHDTADYSHDNSIDAPALPWSPSLPSALLAAFERVTRKFSHVTGGGAVAWGFPCAAALAPQGPPPAGDWKTGSPGLGHAGKWSGALGFPGNENIRFRDSYVLSYNARFKTANWVLEGLTKEQLSAKVASRKSSEFKEDPLDPPPHRAKLKDYLRSGFDRGHLAAAGNHKHSQKAMDDTFFLSNMSPQVGSGFNRDYWSRLEQFCRKGLVAHYESVYVFTGPLFLPQTPQNPTQKKMVMYQVIGDQNVAVPTHFYKCCLCRRKDGKYDIFPFVLPNQKIDDKEPLGKFLVALETLERDSGLFFAPRLANKYQIQAQSVLPREK